MLVIRMQRTGRKGHAMFRVVVQDSRRTPTSGKIVAALGSYDPHAKTTILNKEKAQFYLDNGAQPSDRVAKLLSAEGVKLPDWASTSGKKSRTVRNPDKRRSTRPAEAKPAEAPAEPEVAAEKPVEEPAPVAAEATETSAEEAPAEPAAEAVAAAETKETPKES